MSPMVFLFRSRLTWVSAITCASLCVSLTGCAYCVHCFKYPPVTINGNVSNAAENPAADTPISMVLARGRGYETACQDTAKGQIVSDSYAYMTAEVRADANGDFSYTFPLLQYKSCDRSILLPGTNFSYKHAGRDEILLLFSAGDAKTEWYMVQAEGKKTRIRLLRPKNGRPGSLKHATQVKDISAAYTPCQEQVTLDLRIVTKPGSNQNAL